MIRKAFFALMAVLVVAASSQAGVTITSDGVATPGLAGFKTFTLTATSDVAGEFISVIDFIGDQGQRRSGDRPRFLRCDEPK